MTEDITKEKKPTGPAVYIPMDADGKKLLVNIIDHYIDEKVLD